ncbi:MAG TPA: TetR/AcrR family transcriptional regulator [Thermoanaerobaculia bacterium]|nr:TetR/AcrR family transcriptional regulator [Thermoanaerobaculia bacterium]
MPTTKEEVVEQFRCQAIRDAAMRVVARKGYDHVTVQDIADEAGIAKGTVYLYFKSREDILQKTMSFSFEEFHGRIAAAIGAGGTFAEAVERVVRAQLEYFDERQEFFRLYLAMAEPLGDRRLKKHAAYRTHIARLTAMIEAARANGEVWDAPAERAAIVVASTIRDIALQRLAEKAARPLDEDVAFVRDYICRGIAIHQEKS